MSKKGCSEGWKGPTARPQDSPRMGKKKRLVEDLGLRGGVERLKFLAGSWARRLQDPMGQQWQRGLGTEPIAAILAHRANQGLFLLENWKYGGPPSTLQC